MEMITILLNTDFIKSKFYPIKLLSFNITRTYNVNNDIEYR